VALLRAVCISVLGQIDAMVTKEQRTDVVEVEKVMRKWCDTSKGKDKTMCYYLGVGDAESVSHHHAPRSSAFARSLDVLRLPASSNPVRHSIPAL
jgi:hypothetical protein